MATVTRKEYGARFNVLAKLNRDLLASQTQLARIPASTSNRLIAFGMAVTQLDLFIQSGGALTDQARALQLLYAAESARTDVLIALSGDVKSGVVPLTTYNSLANTGTTMTVQQAPGTSAPGTKSSSWSLKSLIRPTLFWGGSYLAYRFYRKRTKGPGVAVAVTAATVLLITIADAAYRNYKEFTKQ